MSRLEIRRRLASAALSEGELNAVVRRVYAARGIRGAQEVEHRLERLLPVSTLDGVSAAAELLAAERRSGRILIVGDFDADGATSSALMVRALRALKFAHVDFLVPDRFRFGYGLTPEIVEVASGRNPTLIVTVDNGVSSVAGVAAARAAGIRVLVTDHHMPGRELPEADCIVNPNLAGARFESKNLAGVGVAFYVIAALRRCLGAVEFNPADLLDLVALGTVADVVPLDRNNRILVAEGLRRIRSGHCAPGIKALFEAANRRMHSAGAADLAFAVAPRLNAAGRLADMSLGIECLVTDDLLRAGSIAQELSALNIERRAIEARMQAEAVELAAAIGGTVDQGSGALSGICLFDPSWHQGVVGLVAGRVKDRWHRPVIAFAPSETGATLRGSARSIAGANIRDALERIATRHPNLIEKFGGHAMAAGLSIAAADLEFFTQAFDAEMRERILPDQLVDVIYSDGELTAVELCLDTARALRAAEPWGQGFPEPLFDGLFEVVEMRVLAQKHLKLKLRMPGQIEVHEAICFSYVGGPFEDPGICNGACVEAAYRLDVNEFQNTQTAQLNCRQLAAVQPPARAAH